MAAALLLCSLTKSAKRGGSPSSPFFFFFGGRSYATKRTVTTHKVAILGAGTRTGQNLSYLMKLNPVVSTLALHDNSPVTPRLAAFINSMPTTTQAVGYVGEDELGKALDGSHLVIVSAPAGPQKLGFAAINDDEPDDDAAWKSLCSLITNHCPNAYVEIVAKKTADPVPVAWEILKKAGATDNKKLVCVATCDDDTEDTKQDFQGIDLVPGKDEEAFTAAFPSAAVANPRLVYEQRNVKGFAFARHKNIDNTRLIMPPEEPEPEEVGDPILNWFKSMREKEIQKRSRLREKEIQKRSRRKTEAVEKPAKGRNRKILGRSGKSIDLKKRRPLQRTSARAL